MFTNFAELAEFYQIFVGSETVRKMPDFAEIERRLTNFVSEVAGFCRNFAGYSRRRTVDAGRQPYCCCLIS